MKENDVVHWQYLNSFKKGYKNFNTELNLDEENPEKDPKTHHTVNLVISGTVVH